MDASVCGLTGRPAEDRAAAVADIIPCIPENAKISRSAHGRAPDGFGYFKSPGLRGTIPAKNT